MEKIITNSNILEECKNILHIFEILLVTDNIYKCESGTSFFVPEQDKN